MAKRSYVAMSKRAAPFCWLGRETYPTPRGNADNYQNKGVARKAICKTMKTKGAQFDVLRRYTEAEGTPPPVFCTKSPQAIEKKGRESQKERQERKRVRKRLTIEDLSRRRLT